MVSNVLSIIIGVIIIFILIVYGVIPLIESLVSLHETELEKMKDSVLKLILVVIIIVMIGFLVTYLTMTNLIDFIRVIR